MSVRVRFAPSPTGFVHIGSLRTALYNYLFAKKNNGNYILRIEDTDRSRFVEGAIEGMIDSMEWAGITHEEGFILEGDKLVETGSKGPYIQSKRLDIYKNYIEKLIDSNDAYYCFCSKDRLDKLRDEQKSEGKTPKYDKACLSLSKEEVSNKINNKESYVIRLNVRPEETIEFEDIVRGEVRFNSSEVDDQVLIKSDGFPTYHFAVVVDDNLMGITHIIRGEEWLTSTPKHVNLYKALGWDIPKYVHLPNILNKDKKKLSKRQGDVAVEDFKKKGYLPEALINYIALIGWSPEDNQEIFSLKELEENFDLSRVSKSGGVFDLEKLNWMNNYYIKKEDNKRLSKLAYPYLVESGYLNRDSYEENELFLEKLVDVFKEYLNYIAEITEKVNIVFEEKIDLEEEALSIIKDDSVLNLLESFKDKVKVAETIDEDFTSSVFKVLKKETSLKGPKLFKPIRVAITGKTQGPDVGKVMELIGREKLINRIDFIINNYIK